MSRSPDAPAEAGDTSGAYVAGWQATLKLLRGGKSWSGSERHCAFLNVSTPASLEAGREPSFTDVSAVTGLDFPDDGRGLAVVDWDGDGDLDLWLANRTGPRLRLMANRGADAGDSVALRLRGVRANRDAVGARVEVELADPASRALVRTLTAGDGFLSQSSKWLHFGLGPDPEIERVTVRWPGGDAESFAGVRPGGRHLLVEGGGEAVAVAARGEVKLEPAATREPPPSSTSVERAFLPVRVPLPRLRYAPLAAGAEELEIGEALARPLLVNFWATWCVPCVAELSELTSSRARLEAAGLDLLALSVDGLAEDRTTDPADAEAFLARLGFPFPSGLASAELLDKVERVEAALFDRRRPFAVPTSLLLDRGRNLAAIYRGRVDLGTLLDDVGRLDASPERLHAASAPLPGRWVAKLPEVSPSWLAEQFKGYPEDVERYLELAVELDPGHAGAHAALGRLLRGDGRRAEAVRHLLKAVEIDPDDAEAHQVLGVTLRAEGRPEEAFEHLAAAARLRPEWPAPLIPMVWMLIGAEPGETQASEAVRLAERVLELRPDRHPVALDTLAAAYAAAGRLDEAVAAAREAVERAKARGDEALAAEIGERLGRYQSRL